MAESTLNAAYSDLQADVGFMLGFGRGVNFADNAWDGFQTASIERSVKGGLRRFYHCGYDWSFIKPVATLTLANGATIIPLPDDYGGVEGQVVLSTVTSIVWYPLSFVGIGMIDMAAAQMPTTTGRPQMVAVEPLKGTQPTAGQRYQMRFFPISDSQYNVRFQYYLNPDYLTGALPFAYGGPEHAETLLYACLSSAEGLLDDRIDIYEQKFLQLLEVSKELDRRKKPQLAGYNRDCSDVKFNKMAYPWWHYWSEVTVNGVQP